MKNCPSCSALTPDDQWQPCAVDSCEICGICWEQYGYAAFHTEAEIMATSLLAKAPRWPESVAHAVEPLAHDARRAPHRAPP